MTDGNNAAATKSPVVINLDKRSSTGYVDPSDLIQRDSFNKLRSLIEGALKQTDNLRQRSAASTAGYQNGDQPPEGGGQVFFIDGTRGAGKSTFLYSAYVALTDELASQPLGGNSLSLGSLAYIDPSKIEAKEHVLLQVLHSLSRRVDECGLSRTEWTLT